MNQSRGLEQVYRSSSRPRRTCERSHGRAGSSLRSLAGVAARARRDERHAGGLYFSDRGVRPMGRAGAFVAGADDLGAIWYNPAGLADAGTSVLADFSWLRFTSEYTRELARRRRGQHGSLRRLARRSRARRRSCRSRRSPARTTSATKKECTVAGGVVRAVRRARELPRARSTGSPRRRATRSARSTARRSSSSARAFAYKPIEQLRIGVGLGALVGIFQSNVTFSVSPPDRLIAAPEQPEYDAVERAYASARSSRRPATSA